MLVPMAVVLSNRHIHQQIWQGLPETLQVVSSIQSFRQDVRTDQIVTKDTRPHINKKLLLVTPDKRLVGVFFGPPMIIVWIKCSLS